MKVLMFGVLGALLLLLPQQAAAQSVYYPGTVWTSNGTLSPVEKDNVLSLTHAEQGIAWRGLEAFGQTTVSVDSKAYDWNRRYLTGVGGRFTQSMGPGMVRASVSYVRERRYDSSTTAQGMVVAVEAWFGWGQTPRPVGK